MKPQIVILIMLLLLSVNSIDQKCKYQEAINNSNDTCPQNSSCQSNNYCACDSGFIGNCSQKAFVMENSIPVNAQISNTDYTFFSVTTNVDDYVILIFNLCYKQSSDNKLLINVWDDNGLIQVLNDSNVLPGGKYWQIKSGCFMLSTPLMQFTNQPNGLSDNFVLGMKLINPGIINIDFTVQISSFNFWDLLQKFLLIIGCIFAFLFAATIAVFIYKWRRRRITNPAILRQQNNIAHFNKYMPSFSINSITKNELIQQVCSVCLLEFYDGQNLRRTTCNHVFHQQCLDVWCKSHLNCPICRHSLQQNILMLGNENKLNHTFSQIQQDNKRPLL